MRTPASFRGDWPHDAPGRTASNFSNDCALLVPWSGLCIGNANSGLIASIQVEEWHFQITMFE